MKKIVKKLLLGASIAAGVSAIATTPAFAGTLTNANIGGTASTDYYVYDLNNSGTQTVKVESNLANVQKVLDGNAAKPTGNVELRASSEQSGFDFTQNTTLTGKIGDKDITLSSLTLDDWLSPATGGLTFGQKWFNEALSANGFASLIGTNQAKGLFTTFSLQKGFQRFSDPNISYVNQDDTTGLISIGLAGHYDAASLLGLPSNPFKPLQASEIVKYTYNGVTDYLYSFKATESGLTEKSDGISHKGNYEVTINGVPGTSTSVPEPSVMLGLLGICGILATQRQLKKA